MTHEVDWALKANYLTDFLLRRGTSGDGKGNGDGRVRVKVAVRKSLRLTLYGHHQIEPARYWAFFFSPNSVNLTQWLLTWLLC